MLRLVQLCITTNGFTIFPVFLCSICKRTKSSLELNDLAAMGIPPFVIRHCPVILFRRTTYTVKLAELIMTLMTSELGAGQISTVIMKRRTAHWAASARVYLEAQTCNSTLDSQIGSLSSFGFKKAAGRYCTPQLPRQPSPRRHRHPRCIPKLQTHVQNDRLPPTHRHLTCRPH